MGLSYMVDKPTQMIGDNRNATDWAVEKMITDGNRHIDISYMKIREVVRAGEVKPVWIKGKGNPSDILTKAVDKAVIEALMEILTGHVTIAGITDREVEGELDDAVTHMAIEVLHDILECYYD